jgi:hypothetical protein
MSPRSDPRPLNTDVGAKQADTYLATSPDELKVRVRDEPTRFRTNHVA